MNDAAPLHLRLISALIDKGIILVVNLLFILSIVSGSTMQEILDRTLVFVLFNIFSVLLYPVITCSLIASLEATPGKLLTGLAIRRTDGKSISFWRAFLRNQLGYMVSGMYLWLGFFWIVKDKNRQGWHDFIADTKVIVKQKNRAVLGWLALISLVIISLYLTASIRAQYLTHRGLYRAVVDDVREEIRTLDNPLPSEDEPSLRFEPQPKVV